MPSINEELEGYPVLRHPLTNVYGWVLKLQRTNLVIVATSNRPDGWGCVIVKGNDIYPVGGYDIYVSNNEISRAIRIEISAEIEVPA